MRVDDLMTKDVATVFPDALLKDVAAILVDRRVARVPGVVSVQSRLNVREDYTLPRSERSRP